MVTHALGPALVSCSRLVALIPSILENEAESAIVPSPQVPPSNVNADNPTPIDPGSQTRDSVSFVARNRLLSFDVFPFHSIATLWPQQCVQSVSRGFEVDIHPAI